MRRYLGEGQSLVNGAERYGFARHSEDHTAGFVLCNGMGAGPLQFEQAGCTVLAHAGQYHAECVAAGVVRD